MGTREAAKYHNSPTVRGPVFAVGGRSRWIAEAGSEALLWIINVAAVFVITRHLFRANSPAVFWGWDPQSLLAFLGVRHRFCGWLFGLCSDPVIGLGNISQALNPVWFPSYALSATSSGSIDDGPLSFAIGATELFAAVVLGGRLNGFSAGNSFAAGWLLTLTTWQLFGMPKIVSLWVFFPHPAEVLAVSTLMVSAALHLGRGSVWRSGLLSIAIFFGLTYILLAAPTTLILMLPIIGAFVLSGLLVSQARRERLTVLLCWLTIGVAALAFNYVHYLVGLLANTAAGQFPELSKRVPTLYSGEVSLLLWTPINQTSLFSPERLMVGGGLIGSIFVLLLGDLKLRRVALGLLLGELTLLAVGASNYWLNFWFGPSIWYFELFLFPYFVLCICYLFFFPFTVVTRWLRSVLRFPSFVEADALVALALPIAVALHVPSMAEAARIANEKGTFDLASPFPQPKTAITQVLKSEIALRSGQPFRGRVANAIGRILPQEREWQRYSVVHWYMLFATGNVHDGPALWQDDIPTLLESNNLMTPAYFVFMRTFLTEPSDVVTRTLIGTRRINIRMFKALGVRFIITDLPVDGARLRQQITIPTPRWARERLSLAYTDMESFELYLYELDDVNLGQFSPSETKIAKDANDALTLLSNTALSLDRTAIVMEPVGENLTPATLEAFEVERGGYRVKARSEGKSALLLPIEFSRCWKIKGGTAGAARLFRANLLLTGVVFERQLDIELSFFNGPFDYSECRLKDLAEVKRMEIWNAFVDRPEFGIMGWRR
jgi:hypothetical protein